MSTQDPRQARHDEIEQMLDSVAAVGADPLRDLLAAAAGPAGPAELTGEAAALAAFRAARPVPVTETRRSPVMNRNLARIPLSRILGVKAAAAAVVLTSMGGVAIAAGTGAIPSPLPSGKSAEERAADKAAHDAEKAADAAAREVDKAARDADRAADKAARDAAKAAEAHGFAGLCTAFASHSADNKGKWMDSTAFTRLRDAAAAQSMDLTAYCASLLAAAAAQPAVDAPAAEAPAAEAPAAADSPGRSGEDHGQAGDDHGKAGEHGNGAENGQAGDDHGKAGEEHGKSATAGANGKSGEDHGKAGEDHGTDGDDHGSAGEHGNGAENGQAGDDHGKAGDEHGQDGQDHGQDG